MPDSGSDGPEAGPKGGFPTPVRRFTSDIDTRWGDLLLLVCFFIAGLVDSAAFNMYGCFVSMQTGQSTPYQSMTQSLTSLREHNLCWPGCQPST